MTKVRPRCAAVLLAAAVSFGICAATARAADEATPDKALNEAKDDFETAQTFFVRGEYDAAAAKFLEAYNKKPYPAFLFNVAVSYEKAKQLEKAKDYFERYLKRGSQRQRRGAGAAAPRRDRQAARAAASTAGAGRAGPRARCAGHARRAHRAPGRPPRPGRRPNRGRRARPRRLVRPRPPRRRVRRPCSPTSTPRGWW